MRLRNPLAPRLAACLARSYRHSQRMLLEVERGQRALQEDLAQLQRGQLLPPEPLCRTEGASFRAALAGQGQGVILWMLHEANYLRLLLGLGAALGGDRRVTVLRARRQPHERATLEASARALGLELTVLEGPGQSRALLRGLRLFPGPPLVPEPQALGAAARFFQRWLIQAPARWLLWHRFLSLP